MTTAVLTAKGQITIPKQIRDFLGLHKGDKVDFHTSPDGEVKVTPINLAVDDVFGILSDSTDKVLSVEDMDAGIARGIQNKWKQ